MKMKALVERLVLLAALALTANSAAAQTPAQSFADLQPTVKFGQRLIVKGEDGRTTKGRLVSITGNQLEIRRTRWFFREERRTFTEDSVQRIENRDSTWNGSLIGAGVGGLVMFVSLEVPACNQPDDWSCMPLLLSPIAGWVVGDAIDGAINRPVFVSPRGTGITFWPLLGPARVGLAVTARSDLRGIIETVLTPSGRRGTSARTQNIEGVRDVIEMGVTLGTGPSERLALPPGVYINLKFLRHGQRLPAYATRRNRSRTIARRGSRTRTVR